MQRKTKIWLIVALLSVTFLGVSFSVHRENERRIRITVALGQVGKLMAGEDAWGFVRQSATWARGNSNTIDELITALRTAGLLDRGPGVYDFTDLDMGTVRVKMRVGVGQSYTVGASAFEGGNKTFTNKVIFWRQSDNYKILELFFDETGALSGDGALLIYRLHAFEPLQFNNPNAVIESYAFVDGAGSRRQTYSWSDPLSIGEITSRGRVILIDMDTVICVQSVITLNTGHASGQLCGAGNNYYSLAYGVKVAEPNQTTALFALDRTTVSNAGTICGGANPRNFGRFERGGFIGDGFSAASIPADYPSATAVSTLMSQLGTDPAAPDCGGDCDGDDTTQATIDGLASSVQFRDSDPAP